MSTGVPCAPRKNRRAPNSPISLRSLRAQTGGALAPVFTAVLGCTNGPKNTCPDSRGRSRASQGFWGQVSPPCLSWPGVFPACELGERPKAREAQGTRIAGKPSGSPFFWVLFFGEAKKSASPKGAKPGAKICFSPVRVKTDVQLNVNRLT